MWSGLSVSKAGEGVVFVIIVPIRACVAFQGLLSIQPIKVIRSKRCGLPARFRLFCRRLEEAAASPSAQQTSTLRRCSCCGRLRACGTSWCIVSVE